jgi:hypothetical protein
MKWKSNIKRLAVAVVFFCGACNSPYGTDSAKGDSTTVKADGSSHGSGQGGSGRAEGGSNSSGATSTTPTDGASAKTGSGNVNTIDNTASMDSMARDSSSKVKKGKKP